MLDSDKHYDNLEEKNYQCKSQNKKGNNAQLFMLRKCKNDNQTKRGATQ